MDGQERRLEELEALCKSQASLIEELRSAQVEAATKAEERQVQIQDSVKRVEVEQREALDGVKVNFKTDLDSVKVGLEGAFDEAQVGLKGDLDAVKVGLERRLETEQGIREMSPEHAIKRPPHEFYRVIANLFSSLESIGPQKIVSQYGFHCAKQRMDFNFQMQK